MTSHTPFRPDLVSLEMLVRARLGETDALRPLLGSTRRPDAITAAEEAREEAHFAEIVMRTTGRQHRALPPPAPEFDRARALAALLQFPIDLERRDNVGRLLLVDARGDIMRVLLQHGADPNGHIDGWTSLHSAASARDPERVEYLLQHGADPSRVESYGRTPLQIAREYEDRLQPDLRAINARVISLLEGAEANSRVE
jgi:hypothetical protein